MSRHRWFTRAAAILLTGLLAAPGCSMAFSKPPRSHSGPESDCSDSRLPVIFDSTAGSVAAIVAMVSFISAGVRYGTRDDTAPSWNPRPDTSYLHPLAVGGVATAIATAFIISANHGERSTKECRELHERIAREQTFVPQ